MAPRWPCGRSCGAAVMRAAWRAPSTRRPRRCCKMSCCDAWLSWRSTASPTTRARVARHPRRFRRPCERRLRRHWPWPSASCRGPTWRTWSRRCCRWLSTATRPRRGRHRPHTRTRLNQVPLGENAGAAPPQRARNPAARPSGLWRCGTAPSWACVQWRRCSPKRLRARLQQLQRLLPPPPPPAWTPRASPVSRTRASSRCGSVGTATHRSWRARAGPLPHPPPLLPAPKSRRRPPRLSRCTWGPPRRSSHAPVTRSASSSLKLATRRRWRLGRLMGR